MRRNFLFCFLTLMSLHLCAQVSYKPTAANEQSRAEFRDLKLGIFLHWGIYSYWEQGEWHMSIDSIPYNTYAQAASVFNPVDFNADEWVSAIKASGARYICFTSRHHDGFSMWHTRQTPYNIVDATPYKRDVLMELSEACHRQGMRLHLYYSLVDWGREDYPLGESARGCGKDTTKANYAHYLAFMKAQLTELLTEYGPIGAIWLDGEWDHAHDTEPFDWHLDEIYELIHHLQPACLVANNHHHANRPGEDIQCFERDVPGENLHGLSGESGVSESLPLETCMTMNYSWGYVATDTWYRPVEEIRAILNQVNDKGANLLLNIGPCPNGRFPETAITRLKQLQMPAKDK